MAFAHLSTTSSCGSQTPAAVPSKQGRGMREPSRAQLRGRVPPGLGTSRATLRSDARRQCCGRAECGRKRQARRLARTPGQPADPRRHHLAWGDDGEVGKIAISVLTDWDGGARMKFEERTDLVGPRDGDWVDRYRTVSRPRVRLARAMALIRLAGHRDPVTRSVEAGKTRSRRVCDDRDAARAAPAPGDRSSRAERNRKKSPRSRAAASRSAASASSGPTPHDRDRHRPCGVFAVQSGEEGRCALEHPPIAIDGEEDTRQEAIVGELALQSRRAASRVLTNEGTKALVDRLTKRGWIAYPCSVTGLMLGQQPVRSRLPARTRKSSSSPSRHLVPDVSRRVWREAFGDYARVVEHAVENLRGDLSDRVRSTRSSSSSPTTHQPA